MELRELFKQNNVSISLLAKALNIKPQRVNNWLLRNSIPPHFIRAVSKHTGIKIEELLKKIEETKKAENV